jgi:hypothetical protein
LFIKSQNDFIFGFIRVRLQKVYIRDMYDKLQSDEHWCVVDFYWHYKIENKTFYQKELFEKILHLLKLKPHELVYENPNKYLIEFLAKVYELKILVPQLNGFFIFKEFFNVKFCNKKETNSKFNKI